MRSVSTKYVIHAFEKIASIAFLCLGCFFIYQGEVWQRFHLGRTNFAKYDEEITELPTIYTTIRNLNFNAKFGRDFKIAYEEYDAISYRDVGLQATNLSLGNNTVGNSQFVVNLEQRYKENVFQITPVNHVPGMHQEYVLTYLFKNSSIYNSAILQVGLKTQNNSYVHCLLNYFDGKVQHHRARMGEKNFLIVEPERISYDKNIGTCRQSLTMSNYTGKYLHNW